MGHNWLNPDNITEAYCTYKLLDGLRKPLSHLIYVERSQGIVSGVVQFFGCIQLYTRLLVPLSTHLIDYGGGYSTFAQATDLNPPSNVAMLATLDPVTGIEKFKHIRPLLLPEPVEFDHVNGSRKWMKKLETQLKRRGMKGTLKLSIDKITPLNLT